MRGGVRDGVHRDACLRSTRASSASAACAFPAASGSASRSRARFSPTARSCCSTKRRARSMPRASAWCSCALERLMAGRTVLIIAHRLATVRHADRIAVMERGRIIATGTHDELTRSNPLYARLAALQFGAGPSGEPRTPDRRCYLTAVTASVARRQRDRAGSPRGSTMSGCPRTLIVAMSITYPGSPVRASPTVSAGGRPARGDRAARRRPAGRACPSRRCSA